MTDEGQAGEPQTDDAQADDAQADDAQTGEAQAGDAETPVPRKQVKSFGLRSAANKPSKSEMRHRAEAILGRPVEDHEIDYLWESGWM
mgnify:FL=1